MIKKLFFWAWVGSQCVWCVYAESSHPAWSNPKDGQIIYRSDLEKALFPIKAKLDNPVLGEAGTKQVETIVSNEVGSAVAPVVTNVVQTTVAPLVTNVVQATVTPVMTNTVVNVIQERVPPSLLPIDALKDIEDASNLEEAVSNLNTVVRALKALRQDCLAK